MLYEVITKLLIIIVAAVIIAVSGFFVYSLLNQNNSNTNSLCPKGIQIGDKCFPVGAKTKEIDYDDLVSRKVWAYSIPATEIIPERNCYKFSQDELAKIPAGLDYVIRESIPQYPDDYDGVV